MITISYKGLTPKGNSKLNSLRTIVPKVAAMSLRKNFMPTRRAIINHAPTPSVEAIELSRGQSSRGIVGDPSNGRFLKSGGQRSVRSALAEERPVVGGTGNTFFLKWGKVATINSKIGFSWRKSNGMVSKTNMSEPLWANLIQAWEGSMSARITSRGMYPLRPENKVFVPFVDKVVPAYHMVRKGYNSTRITYQHAVRDDIKTAVRKIGLR